MSQLEQKAPARLSEAHKSAAKKLESKLKFRPPQTDLENRNILKAARHRRDAIDIDEARALLTVHIRKRALSPHPSPGASPKTHHKSNSGLPMSRTPRRRERKPVKVDPKVADSTKSNPSSSSQPPLVFSLLGDDESPSASSRPTSAVASPAFLPKRAEPPAELKLDLSQAMSIADDEADESNQPSSPPLASSPPGPSDKPFLTPQGKRSKSKDARRRKSSDSKGKKKKVRVRTPREETTIIIKEGLFDDSLDPNVINEVMTEEERAKLLHFIRNKNQIAAQSLVDTILPRLPAPAKMKKKKKKKHRMSMKPVNLQPPADEINDEDDESKLKHFQTHGKRRQTFHFNTSKQSRTPIVIASLLHNQTDSKAIASTTQELNDDEEMKLLNNISLILDRVSIETLASKPHLVQASQYLASIQQMCQLRTTNIERRMAKRFDISNEDQSQVDHEILDWISKEYMERQVSAPKFPGLSRTGSSREIGRRREMKSDLSSDRKLSPRPFRQKSRTITDAGQKLLQLESLICDLEVATVLNDVDEWNFDILHFKELTHSKPLAPLSFFLLNVSGVIDRFTIDKRKLASFLIELEDLYNANPYHNNVHAADVCQSVYFFLQSDLMQSVLTDLDIFGAILASAVHDVDHTGTTNGFLVETNHELALIYNDQSVLENHHLSSAFRLLAKPDNSIQEKLSREERKELREVLIQMVLATDMKHHVREVAQFESLVETKKAKNQPFDIDNKEDRISLLKMALHCADIANLTKPRYLMQHWVDSLMVEFFQQGDREKKLGLPISPMMDRSKATIERSQVGFITYVIKPLFSSWAAVVAEADVCLKYLEGNQEYWQSRIPGAEAEAGSEAARQRAVTVKAKQKHYQTIRY